MIRLPMRNPRVTAPEPAAPAHVMRIVSFGVPIEIELSFPELEPRVKAILPPGVQASEVVPEDHRFGLITRDEVSYQVRSPGEVVSGSPDVDIALEILGAQLRAFIAQKAPDYVFVHAGVVEHDGQAIVIPGPTFSGKTTLVGELVRAGATYYSDEFAVLDAEGLVHPYAKPLSIRTNGRSQVDHDVATLGGRAGTESLPVGLVIMTSYEPGAVWDPRRLSPGDAVLAALSNTVPAQERPEQALPVLRKALEGAVALEGQRGEAAQVVEQLFESLPV